jgi:hypothetical protein
LGDQIEKNEMRRAHDTFGREKMYIQGFGGGWTEGKRPLEDPDVNGRIILRRNFRKYHGVQGLDLSRSG